MTRPASDAARREGSGLADLAALTRRLAETPPHFLDEPRIGGFAGAGQVHVAAVVNDLLRLHGARAGAAALAGFVGASAQADRNRLALALVACWLLADEWFVELAPCGETLLAVCGPLCAQMAALTAAHRFVDDPERREELVRAVLAQLGARPAGESAEQAADRLAAISAVQRRALLEASRRAEKRAREVREALARKLAEESADKWTRE